MPSRRHQLLAQVLPRVRRSADLDSVEAERARLVACQGELEPGLPTSVVPWFARRYDVAEERIGRFTSYTVSPRGTSPSQPNRSVVYLHGGGFVGTFDPFQVRYAARLASALGARVLMPDYPLTPQHTWRDSHEAITDLVARECASAERVVVAGDSAGGNIALAAALSVSGRGGPQPSHLLLHAPWVDLTTSTRAETEAVADWDPWLFIGKLEAYAGWWAGSPEDLGRPEVSPALADLDALAALPPALMFCGTRDLLNPGCRLLARRAVEAGWDLTYVEEPGLLHVYPILPLIPEAERAWATTVEFLR